MRMDTGKWEFNTMTILPDGRIVFAHNDTRLIMECTQSAL